MIEYWVFQPIAQQDMVLEAKPIKVWEPMRKVLAPSFISLQKKFWDIILFLLEGQIDDVDRKPIDIRTLSLEIGDLPQWPTSPYCQVKPIPNSKIWDTLWANTSAFEVSPDGSTFTIYKTPKHKNVFKPSEVAVSRTISEDTQAVTYVWDPIVVARVKEILLRRAEYFSYTIWG